MCVSYHFTVTFKIPQSLTNYTNQYCYISCLFLSVRQMCTLLQYFCDCELRHRVEAIIAFSDQFVSQVQANQRARYNELMLAFTMSAAETARKTREFRSPPQEQVPSVSVYCPAYNST